jgi:hypothetical protein
VTTDGAGSWVALWYSTDSLGATIGTDEDILYSTALGPDTDVDGLSDGAEVNLHGTDPFDPDSDDDGLEDGAEVSLGTDPNQPDHDEDGVCDGSGTGGGACSAGPDNCPFVPNLGQSNGDAAPAGDACQCGNVDGIGGITATDVQIARERLMEKALSGSFLDDFCNTIGSYFDPDDCDVGDISLMAAIVEGRAIDIGAACPGNLGP